MKDKRDRTHLQFGKRLATLRKEKSLTQGDFCTDFSEFCGYTKPLLIPSISSWEQNHRLPSTETIVQLALYFGVTTDYLFGITDKRNGGNDSSVPKETSSEYLMQRDTSPIERVDFPKYNHQPVYIHFKKYSQLDQWGILMYENKAVVCGGGTFSLTVDMDCYPTAPLSPVRTRITSLQQLKDTANVWIEMRAKEPAVGAFYNGRYIHNPDPAAECLLKADNGQPLPYSGLDTVYWAFRG